MSGSNILKAVAERTTVTVDPDGELRTEVSFGGEAPVDLRVITEKGLDGDETLIVRSTQACSLEFLEKGDEKTWLSKVNSDG